MEGGNSGSSSHNNNNNNNNYNSSSYMMMENGLYPMIMIPHHNHNHHHQSHHSHHENNNNNNNNNKFCCSSSSSSSAAAVIGCYDHHHQQQQQQHHHHHHHLMAIMESQTHDHNENENENNNNNNNNGVTIAINNNNNCNNGGGSSSSSNSGNIKAKIMAHPHYPRLLSAFVSCQKVGAPPEVVARLEEAEAMVMNQSGGRGGGSGGGGGSYVGEDPALDQFMEAYCEMLTKYEQELTKPFKEAMLFLSRVECQFKALTLSSPSDNSPSSACGEVPDRNGSSEEDIDVNNNFIDPSAEDRELKGQLLRKYSGYLGSLRQEFLKKRKKGKLPKEARQQLLEWWSRHYKWPYPSESQKLALAESTGLDQKQINNWFINQRKRHWKPSEDMQFVVMDAAAHSHAHAHYGYMDNVLGNPFPMDITPTLM